MKLNRDDAYEFIYLFSKKFNVSITVFKFEEYFYPEGDHILLNLILKQKKKVKKKITLRDLERSVKEGKLV